jgi:hypothetical protein
MKTALVGAGGFVLLFCLAACSSNENTQTPTPLPTASVDFQIRNLPFTFYYDTGQNIYYANLTIVVYERAGVAITVSVIKTRWMEGTNERGSSTSTGGKVPASGSAEFYIYTTFPGQYRPDKFYISIEGTDVNGHSFSKENSYTLTWSSSSQALVIQSRTM